MDVSDAVAGALTLAAGYGVGRIRPVRRIIRWADWRTRDDGWWWLNTNKVAAAVHVLTRPRGALYSWKHRNDTEPGN